MATVLVVGGDSAIGAPLARAASAAGHAVIATTRRAELVCAERPLLDLAAGSATWPRLRADVAVLCAGITRIASCDADPAGSARLNVEAPAELARRLQAAGAFTVMLSSSLVFDGEQPLRSPEEALCPVTEYGRQKALLESELLRLGDAFCVVRSGKIVSPAVSLLADWVARLRERQPVRAFVDAAMAPVSLAAFLALALRIVSVRHTGVFHFTASRDLTYYDAACELAGAFGEARALVEGVRRDAGTVFPKHAAPDSASSAALFGVRIPQPEEALRSLLGGRSRPRGR